MIKKLNLQLFANDFLTNYGVSLEIDTTPESTETYVALGNGFDNLDEALNEVVQDYQFLSNGGFQRSFVTGMQPTITLTGVRMRADEAQNYIFGKKYELLDERVTNLKITVLDSAGGTNEILFEDVTIVNPIEFGGGSTDGAAISVEFRSSRKPTITNTPPTP